MPKPVVSLRVKVPLPLYERISEYRHLARHETRNQALVALVSAGLAAMAKPPALPATSKKLEVGSRKLVGFAGSDPGEIEIEVNSR